MLDLATEAGGLTPLVQVGGFQTEGLAMKGADGRGYTFRKLEKHPERVLPKEWQDSELRAIAIDQTAAAHPAATAIIGSLAQAVGIPFYGSRLAVMPDDPALGKFREVFGGSVGTFDEYITPGYQGITEIVSSFDLWQKWREGGPANRVDSRAFLKARLFDLVVGNWDRHQGQWRWAGSRDGRSGYHCPRTPTRRSRATRARRSAPRAAWCRASCATRASTRSGWRGSPPTTTT